MLLDERAHRVEGGGGLRQQGTVLIGHLLLHDRRDLAKVLGNQIRHTVHQIAPRGGKHLVVLAHELGPRKSESEDSGPAAEM